MNPREENVKRFTLPLGFLGMEIHSFILCLFNIEFMGHMHIAQCWLSRLKSTKKFLEKESVVHKRLNSSSFSPRKWTLEADNRVTPS